MAYTKTNWQNSPSTTTPINATNLNNIENGIENNDKRLNGTTAMGNIKPAGITSSDEIIINKTSGDAYIITKRTDTNKEINFGIGAGGINRGIYDSSLGWIMNVDSNNKLNFGVEIGGNRTFPTQFIKARFNTTGQDITLTGYTQMTLYSFENQSNCFSIENGLIKVSEPGYYEVSAQIHFQNIGSTSVKWIEIYKYDGNNDAYISATPVTVSARTSIVATPNIIYLTAGQYIKVKIDGTNGDVIRGDHSYSWVYVKKIR